MASSNVDIEVKRYNGTDWDNLYLITSYNKLTDVPSTFPPSSHNHDTRYVRFDTASQGLTDTQKRMLELILAPEQVVLLVIQVTLYFLLLILLV